MHVNYYWELCVISADLGHVFRLGCPIAGVMWAVNVQVQAVFVLVAVSPRPLRTVESKVYRTVFGIGLAISQGLWGLEAVFSCCGLSVRDAAERLN